MRPSEVIVLQPREERLVSFLGIRPMTSVSPFAQRGLDEALGLAVGAGSIGASKSMTDAEFRAGTTELARAIATAVVGEQAANADTVLSIKSQGVLQEGDGTLVSLIGQELGEGQAGVVIDGDMESFPAGELGTTATASIAADGNLLVAGHSLDVEMQQIAGEGMFVTHNRRSRMQIPPTIQMSPTQNTTDRGGTESGAVGDLIRRTMLLSEADDQRRQLRGSRARTTLWAGRSVQQTEPPLALETVPPFGYGFRSNSKDGGGVFATYTASYDFDQRLSTTQRESGILVDVHSVCPRKLDCSSQSASLLPIEWTTS